MTFIEAIDIAARATRYACLNDACRYETTNPSWSDNTPIEVRFHEPVLRRSVTPVCPRCLDDMKAMV